MNAPMFGRSIVIAHQRAHSLDDSVRRQIKEGLQLISLFTSGSETISAGTSALRIISIGFLASTVSVISSGALEGLGMGLPSLMISLLRYVLITIPAAFLLSRFLGASGVWHGFWISELLTAAIAYVIYHRAVRRQA